MARYRLKRKYYGDVLGAVGDGVSTTAGTVIQGAGDVTKSGLGRAAGTVGGAMAAGSLVGGPLGMIGGAIAGNLAAKGVGQGLHNMGNDMKQ